MKPSNTLPLLRALALATAVLTAGGAFSQTPPVSAQPAASAPSEGEVRKVDMDAQKITLRHGPIANLDMPAMTMVFRVSDPAMLQKVKTGDKVRFKADKVGGQITLVEVEVAR